MVALLQWQETTQPVIFADSNGKFTQTEKKSVYVCLCVTKSENICCCHLKIKVLFICLIVKDASVLFKSHSLTLLAVLLFSGVL